MVLLDTNTISELMKHNSYTWQQLLAHERNSVFLCEVVIAELMFGLSLLSDEKKKNQLQKELEPLLKTIDVLSWDRKTSHVFGSLKSRLSRQGNLIADFDIAIAACALSYGCVLITDNLSDFKRIDELKVINWKGF